MSRRVAGLYLLVCTLIGALAINVATHQAVRGSAVMLLPPTPPAAGSCGTPTADGWRVADCSEKHAGEIAQAWPAASAPGPDIYNACVQATDSYLDVKPAPDQQSTWASPTVLTTTTVLSGPGKAYIPGWSWRACVVRPTVPDLDRAGYRGRLRDTPVTGKAPVDLRTCFDRPPGVGLVGVSCLRDHLGEILAARQLRVYGSIDDIQLIATDPDLQQQCVALARKSTGAPDPTFSSRLSVIVHLFPTGFGFSISADRTRDNSQSYILYRASCSLEATNGHPLYRSVFDVGDGPLPLR